MRKTLYFLLTSILIITGCSKDINFTLKGEIKGLLSDTLVVYYQEPEYKKDTIFCKNGVFEYSFIPDTLTMFTLILGKQETLPIYAEKGETVEVKGAATNFTIKGKGENKLMNEIITLLQSTPKENIMHKVDSCINTHNYSYTTIYLIDKYYAHNENPVYGHLEELIKRQSGSIKDTPYIMDLQNKIKSSTSKNRGQSIHTLYGQDRNGKPINWANTRNNYILIDFWASWHPESVIAQDSLTSVLKELKKENFLVYSISLDMDKEAWLKASNRDTTQWRQVCDFKGWNNSLIKSQSIQTLPANILLDKNKRIIARDIRGTELVKKVKEFIQEDKEREKERKNRKRRK